MEKNYNIIIIFIIIRLKIIVSQNEIIIRIKGTENQPFINSTFTPIPQVSYYKNSEYFIATPSTNIIFISGVDTDENELTLMWDSEINNCSNMFEGLTNIIEVDLSCFYPSKCKYMDNMFKNNINLKSIEFGNFDTSACENMKNIFYNCSLLESLDFSKFNTSSLKYMERMFSNCISLISLDLSFFDTSQVRGMNELFYFCTSLRVINLNNWNTSNVISMQKMFNGCTSLKSLNLTHFNTSSVTDMSSMFDTCTELEYLDISSFITSKVNKMSNMFSKCENLISLDVSNFDTSQVTAMNLMFNACRKLISLDITNFNTEKLENMLKMFDSCNSLISLNLSNFNTENVNQMEKMFSGCYALTSLDISNFNTSKVTNLEKMFLNCLSLTSLDLSSFNTIAITNMEGMFLNCSSLSSLDLSNFNTANVVNMVSLLEGCSNLTYLNILNFEKNSELNSENIFSNIGKDLIYCINGDSNFEELLLNENECSKKDCDSNWRDNKLNRGISFFDECGGQNIPDNNENFFISSDINKSIYSYELDNDEVKDQYTNVTYIDFSEDDIDYIYSHFNLNKENDKIFILMADSLSNDSRKATSDFNYVILLENGTRLNLSSIDQDVYVDVSVPIRDLDLSNFDYAKHFDELGYDIYNASSEFYTDYCTSASSGGNDITLSDRKNEIYPNNVTLCKEGCEYKSVNIEEQRIVCECNLNNNADIEKEESNKEDGGGNYFTYFLDKINYKIFKCNKLFVLYNLKKLLSFYVLLGVFGILLCLCLYFLCFGLSNIRIEMFENLPTEQKVRAMIIEELKKFKKIEINHNPPKNKKIKKKNNIKKNEQIKIIEMNKLKNTTSMGSSIFLTGNINLKDNHGKIDSFITINPNHKKKFSKTKKSKFKQKQELGQEKNNKLENLNDLPYITAMNNDKRNIFQVFKSVLFNKLDLIDLIISNKRIKIICICEYILSLLFGFFFNALLYSDDVVSQKYHNNGELDSFVSISLSLISNIITSIVCHYIEYSNGIEEYLDNVTEIRKEYKFLYALNKFYKYLKIKLILFLLTIIILVSVCLYYIVIFCIIYSKSQSSLFVNYIYSQIESLITAFIITLLIVIFRQFGISCSNQYLYNMSKYIYNNF